MFSLLSSAPPLLAQAASHAPALQLHTEAHRQQAFPAIFQMSLPLSYPTEVLHLLSQSLRAPDPCSYISFSKNMHVSHNQISCSVSFSLYMYQIIKIYFNRKKSISHSIVVLQQLSLSSAYLLSEVILYIAIPLNHIRETTLPFQHFIMAANHSCNFIHVILIIIRTICCLTY